MTIFEYVFDQIWRIFVSMDISVICYKRILASMKILLYLLNWKNTCNLQYFSPKYLVNNFFPNQISNTAHSTPKSNIPGSRFCWEVHHEHSWALKISSSPSPIDLDEGPNISTSLGGRSEGRARWTLSHGSKHTPRKLCLFWCNQMQASLATSSTTSTLPCPLSCHPISCHLHTPPSLYQIPWHTYTLLLGQGYCRIQSRLWTVIVGTKFT